VSPRPSTVKIRQFIVENVSDHPRDIGAVVAKRFNITRQAVNRHLRELEKSGAIQSSGRTRSRIYSLKQVVHTLFGVRLAGLQEHVPWDAEIKPRLADAPRNVFDICAYGFTEMLNNAIDHSESETATIELSRTAQCIDIKIMDSGIGIFKKIKNSLGLADELEAITELAKGKLTTDPARHTGEGIFFTSRMFDHFAILSGHLYFSHTRPNDDWLIEDRSDDFCGTYVRMKIALKSKTDAKAVFEKFVSDDGEFEFSKTHVPVKLLQYGAHNLVSRSQAKRLLSRFEMFEEVYLNFEGVDSVGQAFADEIFRVYQNAHPNIRLLPINMQPNVRDMVSRALSRRQHDQKGQAQLQYVPAEEQHVPANEQKNLFPADDGV